MLKCFIMVAIIPFISGCNFNNRNKTCQDRQTVISRYKNGRVSAITVVNCIDTFLSTTISFYPNGDTCLIRPMKNGIPDGITKEFNQQRELKTVMFGKNGKIDSIWHWDDKNGPKRKDVQYYTDFPAQLADLQYDMSGLLVNYCYILDKKIMMLVLYSPEGAITHVDGDYLTAIIRNKEKFNAGDSMTYYFFVATPPNDSIRFSAALHYHDDKDSLLVNELPIVNSRVTISSVLNKSGNYIIPFDILIQHKRGSLKPIHRHAVFRFNVK